MSRFGTTRAPGRRPSPPPEPEDTWEPQQQAEDEFEDEYAEEEAPPEEPHFDESDEEVYQDLMTQVESRLTAANYMRAIIDADFFPGDNSRVAAMVQARLKEVTRGELMTLVGIEKSRVSFGSQPVVDDYFTDPERQALKALAQATLARQTANAARPPAPAPKPEPPKPKPVAAVPRVAPVVARPVVKPQVPVAAPARKPVAPPPQRPAPEPKKESRFARPQQPQARRPAPRQQQPEDGERSELTDRIQGSVVGRNGRLTRTLKSETGKTLAFQDLSPPPINPARMAMPQGEHFTMIMAQKAAETVQAQSANSKVHAAAALAS